MFSSSTGPAQLHGVVVIFSNATSITGLERQSRPARFHPSGVVRWRRRQNRQSRGKDEVAEKSCQRQQQCQHPGSRLEGFQISHRHLGAQDESSGIFHVIQIWTIS